MLEKCPKCKSEDVQKGTDDVLYRSCYNCHEVWEYKVPPGLWQHLKTNSFYIVVGTATCSTNGERAGVERSVVYYSLTGERFHYREIGEFLTQDRFRFVGPAPQ